MSGRWPFQGATPTALVQKILAAAPEDPVLFAPELPAGMAALILGLLERDPAPRVAAARGR